MTTKLDDYLIPRELPPDEYLSNEELAHLYRVLLNELNSFLEQARETVNDFGEVREVEADALDLAVTESDRANKMRFADRERQLAAKIVKALERVVEGEYGMCESCGEAIGYKRLLARPVASLCIDCKTRDEQLENRNRRI